MIPSQRFEDASGKCWGIFNLQSSNEPKLKILKYHLKLFILQPRNVLEIKKIIKTGYAHHIERLMIIGNFMLLCEFDPDEVYRWFMELFIDSYDLYILEWFNHNNIAFAIFHHLS